jgi:hypothetical protein
MDNSAELSTKKAMTKMKKMAMQNNRMSAMTPQLLCLEEPGSCSRTKATPRMQTPNPQDRVKSCPRLTHQEYGKSSHRCCSSASWRMPDSSPPTGRHSPWTALTQRKKRMARHA